MRMIFQATLAVVLVATCLPVSATLSSLVGARHDNPEVGQAATPSDSVPQSHDTWKHEDRLLYELLLAVRKQNFTGFKSLLAPDGDFHASMFSCGQITPTELVIAMQSAPVRARWFEIGSWAGNEAGAIFTLQSAAVLNAGAGPLENATMHDPSFYAFAVATADGTKLQKLSIVTNTAQQQPNATAMARVWERLRAAWQVGDISTYQALLAPSFALFDYPAWKQFPMSMVNRSASLSGLESEFAAYPTRQMFPRAVFVSCDLVITDDVISVVGPERVGLVRRLMALKISSDFQVSFAERFFMTVSL